MVRALRPEGDNNHIYGILYSNEDGEIFVLNDGGSYRVVMEVPDSLMRPAVSISEATTTTIQWAGGEIETWDSGILEDLLEDMKDDGKDPEKEMTYITKDCRSIVFCDH